MKERKHWALVVLGYVFLIVGVVGLIVPIMPGWPFIIPGLILIGEESKISRWVYKYLPHKIRDIFNRKSKK